MKINNLNKTIKENSEALNSILRDNNFSKISFRTEDCENLKLLKTCDFDCPQIINSDLLEEEISEIQKNEEIEKNQNFQIICLLKNYEKDNKFKEGTFYWKELKKILKNKKYNFLLESLQTSIFCHICYFPFKEKEKEKNKKLFFKNSKKIRKNNFDLFSFLLIQSFYKIDFLKFEKILHKNLIKQIQNLKNSTLKNYKIEEQIVFDFFINLDFELNEILRVLNCMPCQKCKLWSIIQFTGIKVAIKILKNENISFYELKCFLNLMGRIFQSNRIMIYFLKNISLKCLIFILQENLKEKIFAFFRSIF